MCTRLCLKRSEREISQEIPRLLIPGKSTCIPVYWSRSYDMEGERACDTGVAIQRQTHQHEIAGCYLWSPNRNRNGAGNQFYENMREVSPGDLVFSY